MQSYCGVSKSVINVLFATENICFNKSINLSPTFDMSKEGQCSSTFMKPMRISQEENPYAVSLSLLSQTDHIVRCNTLLVHGAAWSELCMGIMVMAEGKCFGQIYPLMPRPLEVVPGWWLGTFMLSEDMMRE